MRQGWREVASDGAVRRYESRVETAAVLPGGGGGGGGA
jgi:hypothetical protein